MYSNIKKMQKRHLTTGQMKDCWAKQTSTSVSTFLRNNVKVTKFKVFLSKSIIHNLLEVEILLSLITIFIKLTLKLVLVVLKAEEKVASMLSDK